jgi:hypothetical protein
MGLSGGEPQSSAKSNTNVGGFGFLVARKVSGVSRLARFLILASAVSIGLPGCRDFHDSVDIGFVNETEQLLFIAFRSPGRLVATAGAAPGNGGLALQYPTFADWRGGTVEIMAQDCEILVSLELTDRDVAFVARDASRVDTVPISQTDEHVRKTKLDSEIPCDVPGSNQGSVRSHTSWVLS